MNRDDIIKYLSYLPNFQLMLQIYDQIENKPTSDEIGIGSGLGLEEESKPFYFSLGWWNNDQKLDIYIEEDFVTINPEDDEYDFNIFDENFIFEYKLKEESLRTIISVINKTVNKFMKMNTKKLKLRIYEKEAYVIKTNYDRYIGIPYLIGGYKSFLESDLNSRKVRTYDSFEEAESFIEEYNKGTKFFIDSYSYRDGEFLETPLKVILKNTQKNGEWTFLSMERL